MKLLGYFERYSGFIAVASVWVSIPLSILIARLNILSDMPISSLGTNQSTKHLFIAGLLLSALAFSAFAIRAYKILDSSVLAPAILIAGQIAQVIVAVTPYNVTSVIRPIHVIAAYILAFSMPVAMGFYSFTAKNLKFRDINIVLLQLEILLFTLGLGWFIFAPSAGALSEILTAVVFDVWVVVVTSRVLNSHKV